MSHIEYKTLDQIKWMREAGLVVAEIHRSLREAARPGVTTGELTRSAQMRSVVAVPARTSSITTAIPQRCVFPPMT